MRTNGTLVCQHQNTNIHHALWNYTQAAPPSYSACLLFHPLLKKSALAVSTTFLPALPPLACSHMHSRHTTRRNYIG